MPAQPELQRIRSHPLRRLRSVSPQPLLQREQQVPPRPVLPASAQVFHDAHDVADSSAAADRDSLHSLPVVAVPALLLLLFHWRARSPYRRCRSLLLLLPAPCPDKRVAEALVPVHSPGRVLFFFVFSSVDPSLRLEHIPAQIGNGCTRVLLATWDAGAAAHICPLLADVGLLL